VTPSRRSAAVLGGTLDKFLILAVLTSASASTQTTILPTARTALSMGREGALPRAFARIHPRDRSPDVSTLAMGGVSALLLVVLTVFQREPDLRRVHRPRADVARPSQPST
jgi:amino acid transporter